MCRGRIVTIRRVVATSIEISTTTFSPWVTEWIHASVARGDIDSVRRTLATVRNRWIAAACDRFEEIRHVVGAAVHWDRPEHPHIDLALSRQSGTGYRLIGKAWRCGPTFVALQRAARVGAKLSTINRQRLERDWRNFRHRYGRAVPIDHQLATDLDQISDEVIGVDALAPYKRQYAATTRDREVTHAMTQLQSLDAARARLIQSYDLDIPPLARERKEVEP